MITTFVVHMKRDVGSRQQPAPVYIEKIIVVGTSQTGIIIARITEEKYALAYVILYVAVVVGDSRYRP